jgi:hypothetical protein
MFSAEIASHMIRTNARMIVAAAQLALISAVAATGASGVVNSAGARDSVSKEYVSADAALSCRIRLFSAPYLLGDVAPLVITRPSYYYLGLDLISNRHRFVPYVFFCAEQNSTF